VIAQLWADPGIQACYDQRAEFHVTDGVQYFLDDIKRIGDNSFVPNVQDALHARVRTSGVVSKDFMLGGRPFQIFDVGGQRSERRKWLPLFDHVSMVIFVAAISEYDQVLAEDRSKNRMQEALDLFQQIVTSKHFHKAHFVLFLNKKDLFAEKIKTIDPKKWFPDYQGGCNYEKAEAYFKSQFERRVNFKEQSMFSYTTCATDTKNMHVVLKAVQQKMSDNTLDKFGL